jgi:hypothetical protein
VHWGSFRVGRLANVLTPIVRQTGTSWSFSGSYNPARKSDVVHRREFRLDLDPAFWLTIEDSVTPARKARGHLHLHPDVRIEASESGLVLSRLYSNRICHIDLEGYDFELVKDVALHGAGSYYEYGTAKRTTSIVLKPSQRRLVNAKVTIRSQGK